MGKRVVDALLKTKYQGVCGIHAYNPKNHEVLSGEDYIPSLGYQIQSQKDVIIWPSKYSQARFQLPSYLK